MRTDAAEKDVGMSSMALALQFAHLALQDAHLALEGFDALLQSQEVLLEVRAASDCDIDRLGPSLQLK